MQIDRTLSQHNVFKHIAHPAGQFFRVFSLLAAPMTVAILAALFLALPEQTREIYRVLARDLARAGAGLPELTLQRFLPDQIALGLGMLFLASFMNWLLARNLTLHFAEEELTSSGFHGFALRWLPRLCGAVIPLGAGLGLIAAGMETRGLPMTPGPEGAVPAADSKDVPFYLFATAGIVLLFGVGLVVFAWWRTYGRQHVKYHRSRGWLYTPVAFAGFLLMLLASVIVFAPPLAGETSIKVAQFFGTPAIFCWYVMLMAYFGSLLSYWRLRTSLPIILLLAVYVAAIAWWDTNDNHRIAAYASDAAKKQRDLRSAFRAWYEAREDRSAYEQALGGRRPYPVFLVSAAGGGLYAAEFAATALGRIQDVCPGFSQHVFAISAVSGGGMGAALFSRLVQDEPQVKSAEMQGLDPCDLRQPRQKPQRGFEQRARDYLDADFLAPIVGAALFPDFLQRLLFFPVRAFDRARAFETSLDARWQRVHPDCGESCRPFARPYLEHWRPEATTPALVLNTTDVDLGYRVAIAPFVIGSTVPDEYNALRNFHPTAEGRDVTLATAVGLTARFPWVLPPGSLDVADEKVVDEKGISRRRTMRLLDGAIFENSGVDTVMDMLFDLRDLETPPEARPPALRSEPWVVFHPIVISGYRLNASEPSSSLKGEALSPIVAMLSARVQRAGLASYRMFRERGYHCGRDNQAEICRSSGGIRFLVLNHEDYRLPLGWQLSTFSRDVIRLHIGTAKACQPIGRIRDMFVGARREQRQRDTIAENNCTSCAVLSALRARSVLDTGGCQ